MIKEFKEFISKGNVLDLAVAVVIGLAFAAIVKSFTDDLLMPIIGIVGGKPEFAYTIEINHSVISWGAFLTAIVNFLIIAFAVFLFVKAVNKLQNLRSKDQEESELELTEVELLTEIRDLLVAQNGGAPASSSSTPPSS